MPEVWARPDADAVNNSANTRMVRRTRKLGKLNECKGIRKDRVLWVASLPHHDFHDAVEIFDGAVLDLHYAFSLFVINGDTAS